MGTSGPSGNSGVASKAAWPRAGFPRRGTVGVSGPENFLSRGPFSCIAGSCPLDATRTLSPLQAVTTKIVSRHCQRSPGGQNFPLLRSTGPVVQKLCRPHSLLTPGPGDPPKPLADSVSSSAKTGSPLPASLQGRVGTVRVVGTRLRTVNSVIL